MALDIAIHRQLATHRVFARRRDNHRFGLASQPTQPLRDKIVQCNVHFGSHHCFRAGNVVQNRCSSPAGVVFRPVILRSAQFKFLIICGVAIQRIQDKPFVDGLFHRVFMIIGFPRLVACAKQLDCFGFGCRRKSEVADIGCRADTPALLQQNFLPVLQRLVGLINHDRILEGFAG